MTASASGGVSSDPAAPTPSAYGWLTGSLGSNDAAWYSFPPAAGLRCVLAEVGSDVPTQVTLKVASNSATHSVTTGVAPGSYNRLAIASASPTNVVLGVTSGNNGGDYVGRVRALGLSDIATNNSGPIASSCTHGQLSPLTGNTLNQYTFSGSAGSQIVYSLASQVPSTSLSVISPSGSILSVISPGQVGSVTLPTSGTYSYNVASAGSPSLVDYIIGTIGQGPPGCDPMCTVT